MAIPESPPLILFSGLAADANIFVPQKLAFPNLLVPKWPVPQADESLATYCDRLADAVRHQADAIIGGASFGGIVALHVAQRLKPKAVLLIGSIRSPAEVPRLVRFTRPLRPLIRWIPVRVLQLCCAPFAARLLRRLMPHLSGLAWQFRAADPQVLKWSLARLLDWSTIPHVECPIYHIHGERDFVLPMRYTSPDVVVAGGGHVISLTHPRQVNDFIRAAMTQSSGHKSGATVR